MPAHDCSWRASPLVRRPPKPVPFCGGGFVGNKTCANPVHCCSGAGWCWNDFDHCRQALPLTTLTTANDFDHCRQALPLSAALRSAALRSAALQSAAGPPRRRLHHGCQAGPHTPACTTCGTVQSPSAAVVHVVRWPRQVGLAWLASSQTQPAAHASLPVLQARKLCGGAMPGEAKQRHLRRRQHRQQAVPRRDAVLLRGRVVLERRGTLQARRDAQHAQREVDDATAAPAGQPHTCITVSHLQPRLPAARAARQTAWAGPAGQHRRSTCPP